MTFKKGTLTGTGKLKGTGVKIAEAFWKRDIHEGKHVPHVVPRRWPVGRAREELCEEERLKADEKEPERFQKCLFWTWFRDPKTDKHHKRPCRACADCRDFKATRIQGQVAAQAEVSACVLSLCLSYAPDADGNDPAGAIRVQLADMDKFCKRLRKQGYRFKKVAVGDYGGKNGRVHFHVLLFFEWDKETLAELQDQIAKYGRVPQGFTRGREWRHLAPPLTWTVRGAAFKAAERDPEVLVCSPPMKGKSGKNNNDWKFWKAGFVQAQILKCPEIDMPGEAEAGARYCLRYMAKDAWRDSDEYRRKPFDQLPEHVKHQTRFGPWRNAEEIKQERKKRLQDHSDKRGRYDKRPEFTDEALKWRLGNTYAEDLEAALLRDFPRSKHDIPLERQLCKNTYNYASKPSLGHDFFVALGRHAYQVGKSVAPDANFPVTSVYKAGANYRAKQRGTILSSGSAFAPARRISRDRMLQEGFLPPEMRSTFSYAMGKSSYLAFAEGYEGERKKAGFDETGGPEDVWTRILDERSKQRDRASEPFSYDVWRDADTDRRQHMVEQWSNLDPFAIQKSVFRSLRHDLERYSELIGWKYIAVVRATSNLQYLLEKQVWPSDKYLNYVRRRRDELAEDLSLGSDDGDEERYRDAVAALDEVFAEIAEIEAM